MAINVYIADDHAIVRDGLRALLEANSNIKVVGDAANGRQALQDIRELHPDVVVMDISMPELDGLSVTEEIMRGSPQTRIIILSMLGTPEHVHRALQAGAHGYLLKDSAGREVMEAILSVNAGNIYLSQPIQKVLISDYVRQREPMQARDPLEALSQREREILLLVVAGKTSAEIAGLLFLSPKTVESYRSRMMHKLGVSDLSELIKLAMRLGLAS